MGRVGAAHFVASLELAKEGHVFLKQNPKINDLQIIKNDQLYFK